MMEESSPIRKQREYFNASENYEAVVAQEWLEQKGDESIISIKAELHSRIVSMGWRESIEPKTPTLWLPEVVIRGLKVLVMIL